MEHGGREEMTTQSVTSPIKHFLIGSVTSFFAIACRNCRAKDDDQVTQNVNEVTCNPCINAGIADTQSRIEREAKELERSEHALLITRKFMEFSKALLQELAFRKLKLTNTEPAKTESSEDIIKGVLQTVSAPNKEVPWAQKETEPFINGTTSLNFQPAV